MDNKILIEHLARMPEIKLNKHPKNELYNGECISRKHHTRRKNVIGDINPSGTNFILYKDGRWVSKNKLGIKTIEETIAWIKGDIELLSK